MLQWFSETKSDRMEHLVWGCCMLFFSLVVYRNSLRNVFNPISEEEPFDFLHRATSEPLRCSDRHPVKASRRSRAAASGNTAVAFFWKNCFPEGLNSISVLRGLKNKYYKSNMSWGLFAVDGLGRNPSLTHPLSHFSLHPSPSVSLSFPLSLSLLRSHPL